MWNPKTWNGLHGVLAACLFGFGGVGVPRAPAWRSDENVRVETDGNGRVFGLIDVRVSHERPPVLGALENSSRWLGIVPD